MNASPRIRRYLELLGGATRLLRVSAVTSNPLAAHEPAQASRVRNCIRAVPSNDGCSSWRAAVHHYATTGGRPAN